MADYKGDYAPGSVLYFKFNTAAFADGSPITLGGTPALSCYKDDSTTESTAGITLSVDHDARTGVHQVKVDTSADGTFYAGGHDFQVEITTGTVGGTSVVGRVVGEFSLNNRSALRPATAGRTFAVDASGGAPVSVGTGTGQINLSAGKVPVVQLTASDFAASALNGKGDWLLSSSYTAPLDAAGTRAALGLSIANLDGQLSTIDFDVLSVADNVWKQTFSSFTIAGTTGKVLNDAAATIAANLTAVVAPASTALSTATWTNARAANLDNADVATSTRAVAGDAMTLTSGERDSIADAHIARNIAGGSSTGRTVKDVYAAIRNKVAIVGTTMTVYATDDTTSLWTATLTTDGTAVPITAMDPA